MTNDQQIRSLALRLAAWLQEEASAQLRMETLLAEQERAIQTVDTPALVDLSGRIQKELRAGMDRERRRGVILRGLAQAWGVDGKALTLTSICERLGPETSEARTLQRQRTELRDVAARVSKLGRRIAGIARFHADLFSDLMRTLLGIENDREPEEGVLLDAKG